MSGGFFDYKQHIITDLADEVERLIAENNSQKPDGFGGIRGRQYSSLVIDEFRQAIRALQRAHVYIQRIDWLVSGDDGEESFIRRTFEDLGKLSAPPPFTTGGRP